MLSSQWIFLFMSLSYDVSLSLRLNVFVFVFVARRSGYDPDEPEREAIVVSETISDDEIFGFDLLFSLL